MDSRPIPGLEVRKQTSPRIERFKEREIERTEAKIEMIKSRSGDCESHFVCKWMRQRMRRNREMTEMEENNETDGKKLISEMKKLIEEAVKRDLKTEKTSKKELEDKLIIVNGDIEVSENERRSLSLGSMYPLMEDLEETVADQDFLTATMKIR